MCYSCKRYNLNFSLDSSFIYFYLPYTPKFSYLLVALFTILLSLPFSSSPISLSLSPSSPPDSYLPLATQSFFRLYSSPPFSSLLFVYPLFPFFVIFFPLFAFLSPLFSHFSSTIADVSWTWYIRYSCEGQNLIIVCLYLTIPSISLSVLSYIFLSIYSQVLQSSP